MYFWWPAWEQIEKTIVCSNACHQNFRMYTFIMCFWTSENEKLFCWTHPCFSLASVVANRYFPEFFLFCRNHMKKKHSFQFSMGPLTEKTQNAILRAQIFSTLSKRAFGAPTFYTCESWWQAWMFCTTHAITIALAIKIKHVNNEGEAPSGFAV